MSGSISIIPMYDEDGDVMERVVYAYRMYELLEVEEPYEDWITRMIDYGFEEQLDFFVTYPDPEVDGHGVDPDEIEHYMTLDMAKTVCTLHGTEKARELRRFLIKSEERGEGGRGTGRRELNEHDLFLLSAGLHAEKVELEAEVEKLQRVNHELRDLINRMLERGL